MSLKYSTFYLILTLILVSCGGEGSNDDASISSPNTISSCEQLLEFTEAPTVDGSSNLTQSPQVTWTDLETDCSSLYYEVAISDNAIDANVVNWVYAGNVSTFKMRYILLQRGVGYYALVRALSNGKVISNTIATEVWSVTSPALTINHPQQNDIFNESDSLEEFVISGECSEPNQYIGARINDELINTQQIVWCDGTEFSLAIDISEYKDGELDLVLETRDIYGQVIFSAKRDFAKETQKPTLKKIVRGSDPGDSPTVNKNVKFKLIFDEPVDGLELNDFTLDYISGDLSAELVNIVGAGEVWQVVVNINTGLGFLGLIFNDDNQSVKDLAGNTLNNSTGVSLQNWEIIEDGPPEILSIRADSDDDIPTTNEQDVLFIAGFNKQVFNVSAADFSIIKEGDITSTPIIDSITSSLDGTRFNIKVSNILGSLGSVRLIFNDVDGSIVDKDNVPLVDKINNTGQSWQIDRYINKPTNIKMSSNFIYGELPLDSPLLFWSFPDDDIEVVEVALGTDPDSEIDNFVPWEETDGIGAHTIKFLTGLGECVTYYPSIRLTDKSGNISNPLTDRVGFVWDNSSPDFVGEINIIQNSTSIQESPRFSWPAASDTCGISYYEVAVGTTPGGSDIIDYTPVPVDGGTFNYQVIDGNDQFSLNLELNREYYLSLVAVDISNKVSSFIISNPWTVQEP